MMRSLRDGKPNVMDAEEQRMAEAMCSRSTAALEGRPEGIRRLHLTCTAKEGARFQQQCDMLKLKGLPHFNRMSNPLGGQVYLWIETTFDSGSFITSVKLSHQTVGHDLNRSDDLSKDGYYPVLSKGVALELWIKCSKLSSKGLAELAISTTEKEEEKLVMCGFEQCRPPDVLAEYGVPGATSYLWMRYIEKGRASNIGPTATATNMLLTEAMRGKRDVNLYVPQRSPSAIIRIILIFAPFF